MFSLFNPRAWLLIGLAVALVVSHGFAYKIGRAAVRADFDAYKIEQSAAMAKAQSDADALREKHRLELRKADDRAQKRIAANTTVSINVKREISNAATPDLDCRLDPASIRMLNNYASLPANPQD